VLRKAFASTASSTSPPGPGRSQSDRSGVDPAEGATATEETEVRVPFDADNLYVGINCRDRTPSGIVSTR
jgi:hypothetical protein